MYLYYLCYSLNSTALSFYGCEIINLNSLNCLVDMALHIAMGYFGCNVINNSIGYDHLNTSMYVSLQFMY